MRFSCTKRCATISPSPSLWRIALSGTRTFFSSVSAWSLGMLNVQWLYRTLWPGEMVGTMNAVMPRASPGLPDVRANTRLPCARATWLFQRFMPLMIQSPEPSSARTPVVSSQVASLPWPGSVSPNDRCISPVMMPSI